MIFLLYTDPNVALERLDYFIQHPIESTIAWVSSIMIVCGAFLLRESAVEWANKSVENWSEKRVKRMKWFLRFLSTLLFFSYIIIPVSDYSILIVMVLWALACVVLSPNKIFK